MVLSRKILLFFCLLSLAFPFSGAGQSYNFKNYSVEEGLSQSQVLSIFQDRRGLLWVGTNGGGVTVYDGKTYRYLTERNGLINNVVFSITQDNKGNMLFGTNGGFSIYNGIDFKNFTQKEGLEHDRIFKVATDSSGTTWLGTEKGVYLYEKGKIVKFDQDSILSRYAIYTMYVDQHNNKWFGTIKKGLVKYDGKTFIRYSKENGLDNNFIRTIIEDRNGIIWIGTNSGLFKLKGKNLSAVEIEKGGSVISFSSSTRDSRGNLWLGSAAGLYKFGKSGETKRYAESKGGMASSVVLSILCDREGNIWMGFDGKGVSKFSNETFRNFSQKDSLSSDDVSSIYQDKDKKIWIGTKQGGVNLYNWNHEIYSYKYDFKAPKSNQIAARNVHAIIMDKNEAMWFGTNGGISVLKNGKFSNYNVKDGIADDQIYSFAQARDGKMWIGTVMGVTICDNYRFSKFDKLDKLFGNRVYYIFIDKAGYIWFAGDKGAARYNGNNVVYFNNPETFTDGKVSNILQDESGNYWFGTDQGVFRYDGKSFKNINDENGLRSNKIYLMILDKQQNLWMGSNKGLDKLDLKNYNEEDRIDLEYFGKEDGFTGVECNANAVTLDHKGNIWFGTIKGATVYNPSEDKLNTYPPITIVNNIRLFFEKTDWANLSDSLDPHTLLPSNLQLPYNKNHLTFDFRGISLTIPEKVKYQFMLEGSDISWSPVTERSEAIYSSLPPGNYTFKVKACNNDGIWNSEPTSFSFVINPPFWKTWWFYSLSGIFAITSVYVFISARTRELKKRQRILENEVELRTSELREEKEKVELINEEVLQKNIIIEHKNKDITDSINYAKRIQDALLPSLDLIHEKLRDCFILYQPKDIVSGDFYWYAARGKKLFIAAVDCTGHGVPGAFMSMIGHNLLNQIILQNKFESPGEILKELNNGIKEAFRQSTLKGQSTNDGMDISFCCINTEENNIIYASAQRVLYVIRNSELMEYKGNKTPIGGITPPDYLFTEHLIPVQSGDAFYTTSDGYADQFGGPDGKKFMTKRFKEMLLEIQPLSFTDQHQALYKAAKGWKGNHEQVDDVLVIGFKL